jgi:hypothetical protein
MRISEKSPELIYPRWNLFQDMLSSKNNYHKLIAIHLISNLTRIDSENRFEKIFDEFYDILDGEKTMTAGHIAINSGKIALAKPKLRSKITRRLLNIDKTHRGKQKELIKSYAIDSLNEYFSEAENKEEIMMFVKNQLDSESPKTRKSAENFLKKCHLA